MQSSLINLNKKKEFQGRNVNHLGIVLLCQRILYNRYDGVFYVVPCYLKSEQHFYFEATINCASPDKRTLLYQKQKLKREHYYIRNRS